MKKQINKITLKTDKIVSLSKTQAQNLVGGMPWPDPTRTCSKIFCSSTAQ